MKSREDDVSIKASCSCTGGVMLRAGVLSCATCGAAIAERHTKALYSQNDGERPTGCGRVKFLRVWRRARDAKDNGATIDGRARLLTADAYARHTSAARSNVVQLRPVDDDTDVLKALGLAAGRR